MVRMEAAARLLRLLSLLHGRGHWPGEELAARLGVTARTLRRDVVRLRELGYPVDAVPGSAGGYRLGKGGRLPPLPLDDDEAVAIAVGLRAAATSAVRGVEDAAVAALAKLDAVMPTRLRERVDAVGGATVALSRPDLPQVDTDVLVALATGCRRGEGLRFRYTGNDGRDSERAVAPLRVVHTGRHWYLVARDRDRDAWRTFRVDRITAPELTGTRHTFTDPPDPAALVVEGTSYAAYDVKARVLVHAPVDRVATRIPASMAVVEPAGPDATLVRVAAMGLDPLVGFVCGLPFGFEVLDPPELRARLVGLGRALVARHG